MRTMRTRLGPCAGALAVILLSPPRNRSGPAQSPDA